MDTLWTRIKTWTKLILTGLVVAYIIFFVLNNSGQSIKVWLFFGKGNQPMVSLLVLLLITFGLGVVSTVVTRMVVRTLRQVREYRARNRTARLEREMADMKAKAAMLQTKPEK